ncbi:hypothetical protein [Actinoplanes sp. NPDC020271]|uniref:hypothetical protein n=1 Tax=Actinoplanes sp. NPDC020271 TaxID=3363896 RepID=UPI00379AAA7E
MRFATPTRSAHRAAPAAGLVLPSAPFPRSSGQHRQQVRARPQRHVRREPYPAMTILTRGLAALIVLGICLVSAFLIVGDESQGPAAGESRIASRADDPRPLTVAEVFPTGFAGFEVKTTSDQADCTLAVTGALRSAISAYGCSQAVRATLNAPASGFEVTAGVLNLADSQSAAAVGDQVGRLVEADDGSFTALSGEQAPPGTPIGYRAHGHYLLYCVITGTGGEPVTSTDPALPRVTGDLLDAYLTEQVLDHRS